MLRSKYSPKPKVKDRNQQKKPFVDELKKLRTTEPNEVLLSLLDSRFKLLLKNPYEIDIEIFKIILELLAKAFSTSIQQTNQILLFEILLSRDFFQFNIRKFVDESFVRNNKRSFDLLTQIFIQISRKMGDGILRLQTCVEQCARLDWGDQTFEELKREIERKKLGNDVESYDVESYDVESFDVVRDFRSVSILPSVDELLSKRSFPLRENLSKGAYENVDHYLDVQFHLTREDFIAPLREGIQYYRNRDQTKGIQNRDVCVHENVSIKQLVLTNQGINYTLSFDPRRFSSIHWDTTKRLINGSLLCLSNDNFETVLFAVVTRRDKTDLVRGFVQVKFEDDLGVKDELTAAQFLARYVVIESPTFFEAARPVLKGLQAFTKHNFPLQKYIIDVQKEMQPPDYLRGDYVYEFPIEEGKQVTKKGFVLELDSDESDLDESVREEKEVRVLDLDDWPSRDELGLDESQRSAMFLALTSSVAVIQGPPGTGKTHVGLKIMETLIKNKRIWEEEDGNSSILVVSVTNHALDQFLEGVLNFTDNLVRVGGRSESEILKNYNFRDKCRRSRDDYSCFEEFKRKLDDLREGIDENEKFVEEASSFILHESKLQRLSRDEQRLVRSLTEGCREVFGVDVLRSKWCPQSFLATWLGMTLNPQFVSERELENLFPRRSLQEFSKNNETKRGHFDWSVQIACLDDAEYLRRISKSRQEIREEVELENEIKRAAQAGKTGNPKKSQKSKKVGNTDCDVNLVRAGQLRRRIAETELNEESFMNDREVTVVRNVWKLALSDRWRLYRRWIHELKEEARILISRLRREYERTAKSLREATKAQELLVMRRSDVVGMTTTGAAMNLELLFEIKPKIVIVEEAAKVLESNVITALSPNTQHLILIGDHKQLRPDVNVYELSKYYNLDVSLFERLINNNLPFATLRIQHRMRPEISQLLVPFVYKDLQDHQSVLEYEDVKGLKSNVFFLNHDVFEDKHDKRSHIESHSNTFEAQYLVSLCRYLIQQTYEPTQITILAAYNGQLRAIRDEMGDSLKGVRVATIDRYQGEENDIVLVSFVRNNKENKIGFLKTDNRVNVALSRAKMGLYCVGNFQCFAMQSSFWRNVLGVLTKNGSVGDKQTLVCQKHGNLISVDRGHDFEKLSPEGGCKELCDDELACSHPCGRYCHPEPHKCMVFVTRVLDCGHSVSLECHVDETSHECQMRVTKELDICGHDIEMLCHQSTDEVKCPSMCDYILRCGHRCPKECHAGRNQSHTSIKCEMPCEEIVCENEHFCQNFCSRPHTKECKVVIEKELLCGHNMLLQCCSDPATAKCVLPCEKILPCGHLCQLQCGESCGNCSYIVDKTLECKHTIRAQCSIPIDKLQCYFPCDKALPCDHKCIKKCSEPCETECNFLIPQKSSCKHEVLAPCHLKGGPLGNMAKYCNSPCQKELECNHTCVGTCGQCLEGRVHVSCKEKCGRIQICGHQCTFPCSQVCPPCDQKCGMQCVHGECQKRCDQSCVKCTKKCIWSCPHYQCTKMCHELCDRIPCNRPCRKVLTCGHPCIGLCGELCPTLCRICNRRELVFNENKDLGEGVRFIQLFNCGHCIEVGEMDQWMQAGSAEVKMKECPRCKKMIRRSYRYGNLIKRRLFDVQKAKQQILTKEKKMQVKRNQLLDIIYSNEELNEMFPDDTSYLKYRLNTKCSFHLSQLVVIENQVNILNVISKVVVDGEEKCKWICGENLFFEQVKHLVMRLLRNKENINEFELTDIVKEFVRLVYSTVFLDAVPFEKILVISERNSFERVKKLLIPKARLSDEDEKLISKELKDLATQIRGLGNIEIEEMTFKNDISLIPGVWYKCSVGHVYFSNQGSAGQNDECSWCVEFKSSTKQKIRKKTTETKVKSRKKAQL